MPTPTHIPTGPCWSEITISSVPDQLPPGVQSGDQLVWLNGQWVAQPSNSQDQSADTIFGYFLNSAVVTAAQVNALTGLDQSAGYYNRGTKEVFVHDGVLNKWVLYKPVKGDEFVSIETGDVFPLQVGGVGSRPSSSGVGGGAVGISVPTTGTLPSKSYTVGDGVGTIFELAHGLGTKDVSVEIYDVATGGSPATAVDVRRVSDNKVVVTFTVLPTPGQYRVLIYKH